MTGLLARNSGRLAFLAGAVAPALLALSLTPTIAGGPYFALGTGPNGHGSLGGFGGEHCTLGQGPRPCDLFPGNTQYGAVAAASAPPRGQTHLLRRRHRGFHSYTTGGS